jgi:hypothetical protein
MIKSQIFVGAIALFLLAVGAASGQTVSEPGGTLADAGLAISNPDEYAWRLFFFLNHQAKAGTAGVADETKKFGQLDPDASVVWETWALASPPPTLPNGDCNEVYKKDGSKPVDWDKLDRTKLSKCLAPNVERETFLSALRRSVPTTGFVAPSPDSQEVHMNRAAYEFITRDDIQLYNLDGQEALLQKAVAAGNRQLIVFPGLAKEVKAQWQVIDDTQKGRYLWREATSSIDHQKHLFGLVALHILTKDLPNWFWADFGHVDCEGTSPVNGCDLSPQGVKLGHNNLPATTTPIDATTRGPDGTGAGPSGTGGLRNETVGTVWANYILRGTQTAFTSADGEPTILSNPVIEGPFQQSSCISCHALATIAPRLGAGGDRLNGSGFPAPLGTPNPTLLGADPLASFTSGPVVNYLQMDFLWSPMLARPKTH